MYRILGFKGFFRNKNKLLRIKGIGAQLSSGQICCQKFSHLCNHHNAVILQKLPLCSNEILTTKADINRGHSTTTSLEMLDTIKKKKRKKSQSRKFAELLTVNNTSTKHTKASVHQLKAQKLSDFINDHISHELIASKDKMSNVLAHGTDITSHNFEQTPVIFIGENMQEMNLSNETLAEILESYQVLKELHSKKPQSAGSAENTIEEELLGTSEILVEEEIIDVPVVSKKSKTQKKRTRKPKIKNPDEKPSKGISKYENTSQEMLARQKSFHLTLSAYLDICLTSGMINRAYATVMNYRCKRKMSIDIYNKLLHGYAENGNILKLKDILRIVKEDGIEPTPQTYAAIFECLGRLETTTELKDEASAYLLEANTKGIEMNDVLDHSKFTTDQREIVLSLLREIDPDFHPHYTPPMLNYDNHLLNPLNEHVKPIGNTETANNVDSSVNGFEIMHSKVGFSKDQLDQFAREQFEMELKGHLTVKSIQKFPEPNEAVKKYRNELEELRKTWSKQISKAFHRDVNSLKAATETKSNRSINLFPYLKALTVAQYTDILLNEAQQLIEGSDTFSVGVAHLYRDLGNQVEARYHIEQKRMNGVLDKTCEVYNLYCDTLAKGNSSDNPRQLWQRLVHECRQDGPSMDIASIAWPRAAVFGVGKFLYNIMKNDLKINVNAMAPGNRSARLAPAFYSLYRYEVKSAKEQIKPHPVLVKLHRKSQQDTLNFPISFVPMVCPPQPWTTAVNGGYLMAKSELIRLPQQAHQQTERINEAKPSDIYPTLDSLNQLGSVPWTINEKVLDVVLEIFNSGGNAKLDVPEPPSSLPPIVENKPRSEMTNYDRFNMMRMKMNHRRKQGDMYSLWCDALYRLSLANHFRKKVFWLPQNIDFRGRVYPIPPHLNHLGHDLARCLMVFHQKKPLGPDGYNWLKLHCINLTGLKKRESIQDRLLYAEEIMDDILDSADRPLTGRMWWSKSDEPWQTLACCMEIAKVSRCPNPSEYQSGFPIHQDGSCNGLQHYAALGRDTPGAISVNLSTSDVPQDVYSAVAALVEENRAKDASNNVKVAQVLEGFIKRKVIKQTVMTTVYGVTRFGARKQIARQLEYIDEFPKDYVWPASSYLTIKTFNALSEMFTSAKEIQDWFTDCARLISAVRSQNVEWITPLGLPIVQPYNRADKSFHNKSKSKLPEHFAMDLYEKPNIMKQKNAFPPNFVHSLDSSHMMLTSLYCERAGLTFISVHDCYWTHPCTVATMNKICRDQFVALHSNPILEDLSKFLKQKYSYDEREITDDGSVIDLTKRKLNLILQQYPNKGDFDLRQVLNSVYFFS
ncbi:DNA-directed RNA polymerase, mitochondrial [Malaya genurostris]|uniref:DNA-directed RNA polymerase, mitochondrial n=1 Tax=Malaya genurostris TaxID=325434 RepID=UPI0026F39FD8|nr:DNA-directed RNA polymerase, mitochondrial [Malaya genurostris]